MQLDNELVHEAWINLKAGDIAMARRFAERALDAADDTGTRVKALYILSQVTDDLTQKRDLLETLLAHDRTHAEARRALAILDGKLNPADIVNADELPAQSAEQAQAERFTCPRCGARRVFAPDGHSLACEHCGYRDALGTRGEVTESDFFTAMATVKGHRKPITTQVFHCQGCGAEFTLAAGVISTTCAYCDSPHIIHLSQSRELHEPDCIVPFLITQKQAVRTLIKWVEEVGYKPSQKVEIPRGIYIPLWTFDLGGGINYSGEIIQTETEGLRENQRRVWVRDQYPLLVNDLAIPAAKMTSGLLDCILPTFDLKMIKPYDPRYLASWPAEIYDISMSDASLEARARVARIYLKRVKSELTHVYNLRTSTVGMTVESFKLVLLPLWITEIRHGGRIHTVIINGQNGSIRSMEKS